jgi:hypothetical protein
MRFVAFPATEYDEVLSGYQPGQVVERWENQRFEDHLCPRPQGTSLTMVGKNILTGRVNRPGQVYIFGQNVFSNHCQTSTLRTRTEMVFETLVFSPLNHLTQLIARENITVYIKLNINLVEVYDISWNTIKLLNDVQGKIIFDYM